MLASRECGDIGVLLALGVLPRNIVAVDLDAQAVETCKRRFPGVRACRGELGDVVKMVRDKRQRAPLTVFADLCSTINKNTLQLLADLLMLVKDEGVMMFEFLRGRETQDIIAEMDHRQRELRRRGEPGGPTAKRTHLLQTKMAWACVPMGVLPLLFATVNYKSGPSPMQVAMFLRTATTPGSLGDPIVMARVRREQECLFRQCDPRRLIEIVGNEVDNKRALLRAASNETPEAVALGLNIEQKSVAPLRAHLSRGSFSGGAGE